MKQVLYSFLLMLTFHYTLNSDDRFSSLKIVGNASNEEIQKFQMYTKELNQCFQGHLPIKSNKTDQVIINSKNNVVPISFVIFGEYFHLVQPSRTTSNGFYFNPIIDLPGVENNEFCFKKSLANYWLTKLQPEKKINKSVDIKYAITEGLTSYLAENAGANTYVKRNYFYYLVQAYENNKVPDCLLIVNYHKGISEQENFSKEAFSWAFVKFLLSIKDMNAEKLLEKMNVKYANISELENSFGLSDINSHWHHFLHEMIYQGLPHQITVNLDSDKEYSKEELKKIFSGFSQNSIDVEKEILKAMGAEINNNTLQNLQSLSKDTNETIRNSAICALKLTGDRKSLPLLTNSTINDTSKTTRKLSANAIKSINYQLAPSSIVYTLRSDKPDKVIHASEALAEIGDPYPARELVRALEGNPLGNSRPTRSYIAIGKSVNYVSDYNVVNNLLDPVVSTAFEGVVMEVSVLWITTVRPSILGALNGMALGVKSMEVNDWYNWYKKN